MSKWKPRGHCQKVSRVLRTPETWHPSELVIDAMTDYDTRGLENDPTDGSTDAELIADGGSKHTCDGCGESFRTLTALRLHEKDDCPERETYDELNPDADDVGLQAAQGLLQCQECGRENPTTPFEETPSYDGDDYHLIVEFTCAHCGFDNENRVVMTGVDEADLANLPAHLQPDETVMTDGGTGAVDHDYDESELSASEQLAGAMADMDGRGHDRLQAGDIAIDLVSRQPLYVRERVAETVVDYYDAEGFDLATYKQHHYLPVRTSDPVFECVFIGGLDDLHRFSDVYDYPAGRLARVPVELAGDGDA